MNTAKPWRDMSLAEKAAECERLAEQYTDCPARDRILEQVREYLDKIKLKLNKINIDFAANK